MRAAALLVVVLLVSIPLLEAAPGASAQGESGLVVVGDLDQMRSRNVLRVFLGPATGEDIGVGILQPVYSTPVLAGPVVGELRPYIAKGVDANGDGVFDAPEYGAFRKDPGTNATEVVAYFDFNGVQWHDGPPMGPMDLYFSLLIASLSPRYSTDLRVLWDRAGAPGSNFSSTHWLAVSRAPKSWTGEGSLGGDPALRVAIRFRLQEPFARFFERTLGGLWLLPRHVWEGDGGGRHADFGRAIYPEGDPRAGQGIPANETLYRPFDYSAAEAWAPTDADVIGSGPFRFSIFIPGQLTRLDRNDAYYVGTDPLTPGVVYDSRLAASLHRPFVGGFLFKIYRTTQLGVLALRYGEIDYFRTNIPVEFVPDILGGPLRVWTYAGEAGFTYLGYNMRRPWLGYNGTPRGDAVDTGRPFRLAAGHLFDKRALVATLLQNYGVIADSVVSPASTYYYNSSLPSFAYDLGAARAILDNAGWVDSDGDGWRELPGIGDAGLRILVPVPDFDPIRLAIATMWGSDMRAVGLNVGALGTAYSVVVDAVEAHAFDMFILGWRISDPDPDYLFSLFHCSGTDSGLNYPGYCDSTLDRVLEESRTAMDPDERARLLRWAQGIIMEDRPVEPLFYRTSIQATRDDRFVNWTQTSGGVWDYWSWIGVRPASQLKDLRVFVAAPSAIASGGRAAISVRVRDAAGTAVADATVSLAIVAGDGGRFVESGAAYFEGRTDAGGAFAATFEAPNVLEGMRDIVIQVTATHEIGRAPAERTISIAVFATGLNVLSLQVSFPAGDITMADAPLPIRIDVRDSTGAEGSDALVRASAWPPNGTLSRTSGTGAEMRAVTFAPPSDLGATREYGIEVTAEKAGSVPARVNVSVLVVVPEQGAQPPSPGAGSDTLVLAVGVAGSLLFAAGLIALVWVLRRRRRDRSAK